MSTTSELSSYAGGARHHVPRAAGRAETTALAAESHQGLGTTLPATHAQETVFETTAFQKRLKLLLYGLR